MNLDFHLKAARILTNLLENQFTIGGYKIGLDPVMGLLPGLGDVLPLFVSIYIVWIAAKMRVPNQRILQMVGNNVLEFFLGLFPVIGGIADNVYKANTRNMKILERYSESIVEGQVV